MTQRVVLFVLVALVAGCVTPNLTVLTKKSTKKPYSKLLVVYIDGAIDLSIFDSTAYNICLRSAFLDTNTVNPRNDMEGNLADRLSAPRSLFVRSVDVLDTLANSYAYFNRQLDSLGIDAIFLINRSRFHTVQADTLPNYDLGRPPHGGVVVRRIPNDVFTYYLFEPHQYLAVWKAEQMLPGRNLRNGRLPPICLQKLEKGLVEGGYIAPHLAIRTPAN